jgi:hypothetical protein
MKMKMGGVCSTRGQMRNTYSILVGNFYWFKDLSVDGKITLKWILKKCGMRM